jgi:hypothetical protein
LLDAMPILKGLDHRVLSDVSGIRYSSNALPHEESDQHRNELTIEIAERRDAIESGGVFGGDGDVRRGNGAQPKRGFGTVDLVIHR